MYYLLYLQIYLIYLYQIVVLYIFYILYLFVLLFLSIFVLLSHSQPNLTVKEILEKNVQAAGGKEKLSQIENYSFKYRTKSFSGLIPFASKPAVT